MLLLKSYHRITHNEKTFRIIESSCYNSITKPRPMFVGNQYVGDHFWLFLNKLHFTLLSLHFLVSVFTEKSTLYLSPFPYSFEGCIVLWEKPDLSRPQIMIFTDELLTFALNMDFKNKLMFLAPFSAFKQSLFIRVVIDICFIMF